MYRIANDTHRVLELDLLKSFTIIFPMIGIHCMYDLTSLNATDGLLETVLNIISSQFTAPVFMFCMGMTLVFSRHQEPVCLLRRGIKLITFGMVLNAFRYLPEAHSAAKAPFTRVLQNDWGFYSMHTPDALFTTFGVAPFMLGLFHLLSKAVPEKLECLLCYPSRHINQYYCISWVLIMWTANLFLFVPKASTDAGFLLMWSVIVLLTTVTVFIYKRYLKAGFNAFFSRHSAAWIVAIWFALILFGVWFFTAVPEPYTMPY